LSIRGLSRRVARELSFSQTKGSKAPHEMAVDDIVMNALG
jgi:hypothetical protein